MREGDEEEEEGEEEEEEEEEEGKEEKEEGKEKKRRKRGDGGGDKKQKKKKRRRRTRSRTRRGGGGGRRTTTTRRRRTNQFHLFQVEGDCESLLELFSELRVELQDLPQVDQVDLVDVAVGQGTNGIHGLAHKSVRLLADVILTEDVVLTLDRQTDSCCTCDTFKFYFWAGYDSAEDIILALASSMYETLRFNH